MNTIHTLRGGYQWVLNSGDSYEDCSECGNAMEVGERIYYAGADDSCPLCSLRCARLRREQLKDCAQSAPQTINVRDFRRTDQDGRILRAYIHRSEPRRVARVIDGKPRWVLEPEQRIVFTGAASGEHSLDLSVSDMDRILAHWAGYLEANGVRV